MFLYQRATDHRIDQLIAETRHAATAANRTLTDTALVGCLEQRTAHLVRKVEERDSIIEWIARTFLGLFGYVTDFQALKNEVSSIEQSTERTIAAARRAQLAAFRPGSPLSPSRHAPSRRADRSSDRPSRTNQTRVGGMTNVGATCYMNTAMQQLAAVTSWRNLFHLEINPVNRRATESEELFVLRQQIQQKVGAILARLESGQAVRRHQAEDLHRTLKAYSDRLGQQTPMVEPLGTNHYTENVLQGVLEAVGANVCATYNPQTLPSEMDGAPVGTQRIPFEWIGIEEGDAQPILSFTPVYADGCPPMEVTPYIQVGEQYYQLRSIIANERTHYLSYIYQDGRIIKADDPRVTEHRGLVVRGARTFIYEEVFAAPEEGSSSGE